MLFPRELLRFFEKILGVPVGDGSCWVSIVTLPCRFRQSWTEVLAHMMSLGSLTLLETSSAPSDGHIRTPNMHVTRLCLNVVAGILWSVMKLRFSFPGLVNDLTCLRMACCHVSWVSHLGLVLPAEVSLEHDAALPVNSQSAPPSARVFNVASWVIDEPVCDMDG